MPKVDETSQIPVVPEMTKEEMEFEKEDDIIITKPKKSDSSKKLDQ